MSNVIDLTGQIFGDLTVIRREGSINGRAAWLCQCTCGNQKVCSGQLLRKGGVKSCGCKKGQGKLVDLTGQIFGDLTVIERNGSNNNGESRWLCKCKCGNEVIFDSRQLRSGRRISCGCEGDGTKLIDLTGQRFGKLTVLSRVEGYTHKARWLCQCDCGAQIETLGSLLRSGQSKSCGCVNSWGEVLIAQSLQQLNIEFIKEKTFDNLVSKQNGILRFDFYLPKHNVCIEFQGEQHYRPISYFGGEDYLNNLQECDKLKEKYCRDNGIKLIKILYKDRDNINKDFIQNLLNAV